MTDNFGSGNLPDDFPGAPPQGGPQGAGQMPPQQQGMPAPGQMPPAQGAPGGPQGAAPMPPPQQGMPQGGQMPQAPMPQPHDQAAYQMAPQGGPPMAYGEENKKIVAGICALLVGGFGVHKFILGYKNEGIILAVAFFLTCGLTQIVGLIEGIIYLTKSDAEFYQTYQVGQKTWF